MRSPGSPHASGCCWRILRRRHLCARHSSFGRERRGRVASGRRSPCHEMSACCGSGRPEPSLGSPARVPQIFLAAILVRRWSGTCRRTRAACACQGEVRALPGSDRRDARRESAAGCAPRDDRDDHAADAATAQPIVVDASQKLKFTASIGPPRSRCRTKTLVGCSNDRYR
jgi:hypothetical protein